MKTTFAGRHNINNLIDVYGALPGMIDVSDNRLSVRAYFDACLAIRDQFHYYIFLLTDPDCVSDACNADYHGFETDASGNSRYLGIYRANYGLTPEPAWFSELQDCRAFLIR